MYFHKSDDTFVWIIFLSPNKQKATFRRKNCDLYVVYMLSFCELNRSFLQKIESRNFSRFKLSAASQTLAGDIITGFGLETLRTSWKHFFKEKNQEKKVTAATLR